MKTSTIILFFIIVFSIYSLANLYVLMRGIKAMPAGSGIRTIVVVVFIFLAMTFIVGKVLERTHSGILSDVLNVIGGFWLAFLLYAFLFVLIADIVLLANSFIRFWDTQSIIRFREIYFSTAMIITFILITVGFINAITPTITNYDVTIPKRVEGVSEVKVLAISDIHLGSTIRKRSMRKLSAIIKKEEPDIVLLLGDILDGEIEPVLRDDLLSYLEIDKNKSEVYAITGNHEFIGGADRTIPYIESKGLRLLKDEVITTSSGIQIAGRVDRDGARHYGSPRLSLTKLLDGTDKSKPVILLDHQPYRLDESADTGVDLHLSGHTHNGQFWPISLAVSSIFELPYGYMQKRSTHFIVSSGFGVWGPRVRLGSRSEVVTIDIKFLPDQTD